MKENGVFSNNSGGVSCVSHGPAADLIAEIVARNKNSNMFKPMADKRSCRGCFETN